MGAKPDRCRRRLTTKSAVYGSVCNRELPCPIHDRALEAGEVLVADLVVVLEPAIAERNSFNPRSRKTDGGLEQICHELVRSGVFDTKEAAQRRLYSWRSGSTRVTTFDQADAILTALELTWAWDVEPLSKYAPAGEEASFEEFDTTCAHCGHTIDWEAGMAVRVEVGQVVNVQRRWHWWPLCAECFCQIPSVTKSGTNRLTVDELRGLYLRYVREELGMSGVAASIWQAAGFKSEKSAIAAIQQAWRRFGWPMRTRSQTKTLNRKHGRRLGHKIPLEDLRKLHVLHMKGDKLSAFELARRLHTKYGYRTPPAMHRAMLDGWKKLGLKARDRIESTVMMSTKNGLSPRNWADRKRLRQAAGLTQHGKEFRPQCVGTKKNGKRCVAHARAGSLYCYGHDPETEARRNEICSDMRARYDRAHPLAEWPGWQDELRYVVDLVGRDRVAAALGVKPDTVKTLLTPTNATTTRFTVRRATRWRTVFAELTLPAVPIEEEQEEAA